MSVNESIVEEALLGWFQDPHYSCAHGPDIAPGGAGAERDSFGDVVLAGRLRDEIRKLNPTIPESTGEDALRKVQRLASPSLI